MTGQYDVGDAQSVLASLRKLIPNRQAQFTESLRIAEQQAAKLLRLTGLDDAATPNEVITELPRILVFYRDIPTSGLSYWDGHDWVITINRFEPRTRQRFTLFHEYKHIIDHGRAHLLYRTDEQAEQAADYFAGCALMPRTALKSAWGQLLQRPDVLARRFNVSARAVTVRLAQTGLTDRAVRCEPPSRAPHAPKPHHGYARQQSAAWTPLLKAGAAS